MAVAMPAEQIRRAVGVAIVDSYQEVKNYRRVDSYSLQPFSHAAS